MTDITQASDGLDTSQKEFDIGLAAFKSSNWEEAIEHFGQGLQARIEAAGGDADECAELYFYYGASLFHKAQEESDVFGTNIDSDVAQPHAAGPSNAAGPSTGAGPSNPDAAEKGEDTEDQEAPGGGDQEAEGEGEEEEEDADDDMQLAWENLEVAKTIYERNKDLHRDRLSDTYTLLADLAMEQENFDSAADDYRKAKELVLSSPTPAERPDRRLAELHFKVGLVLQFLQKPEEALKEIEAAIDICKKSQEALDSVKTDASQAEISSLQSVLEDLNAKQEELQQAVEERQKQKETIQAAFQRAFGAAGSATAAGPSTAPPAASQVVDLGTVGQGRRRINLAPVQQDPGPAAVSNAPGNVQPKRSLEDLMAGGPTTNGSLSDLQANGAKKQCLDPSIKTQADKVALPKAPGKENQSEAAGTSAAQPSKD